MMRDGNRTRGVIVWSVLRRQLLDWRMFLNISIYISTFTNRRVLSFKSSGGHMVIPSMVL
jgi:hypothetical protein